MGMLATDKARTLVEQAIDEFGGLDILVNMLVSAKG